MAAADSHIQTAAPSAPLTATAHVDFRIIIPQVLSLRVAGSNDRTLGAQTVAVMSNSRNVTLHATIGGPDVLAGGNVSSAMAVRGKTGTGTGGGNIILSAAARRVIAQDALCEPARGRPGNAADRDPVNASLLCTVSMP